MLSSTVIPGLLALIGPAAPFLLAIAGIAAATGLLYIAWRENWLGMRDVLKEVMPDIDETLRRISGMMAPEGRERLRFGPEGAPLPRPGTFIPSPEVENLPIGQRRNPVTGEIERITFPLNIETGDIVVNDWEAMREKVVDAIEQEIDEAALRARPPRAPHGARSGWRYRRQ